MVGSFILENSSREGLLEQLRLVSLHELPADYLDTWVQRVMAVTPAEVQQVARTYLRDEEMTIVIAGDQKVIEEQIKPYATPVAPKK